MFKNAFLGRSDSRTLIGVIYSILQPGGENLVLAPDSELLHFFPERCA
jgi:hypothetical protein